MHQTVYALNQQCAYNWTFAVAEDVLLVLEQQAHSAVSQQPSPASSEVPSAPSTSSQHPSAASVSAVSSPGTLPDSSPPSQGAAPKSMHSDSTIIPLRGYKRAMVKSMVKAGAIPHFHLCDELDMRAMMSLRHRMKGDSVLQGVHLTFLPVMIKVLLCIKHSAMPVMLAKLCTHVVCLLCKVPSCTEHAAASPLVSCLLGKATQRQQYFVHLQISLH